MIHKKLLSLKTLVLTMMLSFPGHANIQDCSRCFEIAVEEGMLSSNNREIIVAVVSKYFDYINLKNLDEQEQLLRHRREFTKQAQELLVEMSHFYWMNRKGEINARDVEDLHFVWTRKQKVNDLYRTLISSNNRAIRMNGDKPEYLAELKNFLTISKILKTLFDYNYTFLSYRAKEGYDDRIDPSRNKVISKVRSSESAEVLINSLKELEKYDLSDDLVALAIVGDAYFGFRNKNGTRVPKQDKDKKKATEYHYDAAQKGHPGAFGHVVRYTKYYKYLPKVDSEELRNFAITGYCFSQKPKYAKTLKQAEKAMAVVRERFSSQEYEAVNYGLDNCHEMPWIDTAKK